MGVAGCPPREDFPGIPPWEYVKGIAACCFGLGRYDLQLLLIPAVLGASLLVHLITGFQLTAAMVPASLTAVTAIPDAVFLLLPTRGDHGTV